MNLEVNYPICCTGDVVTGDEITFTEGVWGGTRKRPVLEGKRRICATVAKDSYGAKTQQHTFTLIVVESEGVCALAPGNKILRKGRNVYRNGAYRKEWNNEAERCAEADDKHARGDAARRTRDNRRMAAMGLQR